MGHSAQYFTDDFVICDMSKGLCGKAGRGGGTSNRRIN